MVFVFGCWAVQDYTHRSLLVEELGKTIATSARLGHRARFDEDALAARV